MLGNTMDTIVQIVATMSAVVAGYKVIAKPLLPLITAEGVGKDEYF